MFVVSLVFVAVVVVLLGIAYSKVALAPPGSGIQRKQAVSPPTLKHNAAIGFVPRTLKAATTGLRCLDETTDEFSRPHMQASSDEAAQTQNHASWQC